MVQGVGFRPFVKRLADRLALPGVAFNTASSLIVEIDSQSKEEALQFVERMCAEAPAISRVERCLVEEVCQEVRYRDFRIEVSVASSGQYTLTSPDLATCSDCLNEMADPADRRFAYPFTNCTNCGPRYSIIRCTPYDRVNTTMDRFTMCSDCASEYADPANRRFHAEPIACPVCGPQLSMEIDEAIVALQAGKILGIKSIGGFQLACDAFCAEAVDELRLRKRRSRKPFALMMRDLAVIEKYCFADHVERQLLCSAAAPVVLLALRSETTFPPGIAPGLRHMGVMLPYTPLHHLLFTGPVECLVMTSGNISEEPIVVQNKEAVRVLSPLADVLVMHDRDIYTRVDDSVVRTFEGTPRLLRRARGFAPIAIALEHEMGDVLATGAELKNTLCLTRGRYAIPSQHIGDLENYETLRFFEESLRNLQDLYQCKPRLIVHDLHPDYLSTGWALRRPEPKLAVQHHHAHIASCMAENGVTESVIGVAFDGTGLGEDGQVWGGEFLLCNYRAYRRCAHLRYVALPGGDRAARQGWRMAAAHLYDAVGPEFRQRFDLPCWEMASALAWKSMDQMMARPAIRTSSCGRLFDAVAAICGIGLESSYEGESAMLLEAAATADSDRTYRIDLDRNTIPWTVDTRPLLRQIADEITSGRSPGTVARCFHDSVASMIGAVCSKLRERTGVDKVCLSGGVFQNFTLLSSAAGLLRRSGFELFLHSQVPPNDGGLSLGQAVIGAAYLERTNPHVSGDSR